MSTRPALLAAILGQSGRVIPALPSSGLLSEWRFAEGGGTTVADSAGGGRPINLALPTTPNVTWTSKGVSLAAGLVQTPSIPGARTVAMLHRVPRNQASGFLLSGGSGSGDGVLNDSFGSSHTLWVSSSGRGVTPMVHNGSGTTWAMNRGGWVLLFVQYSGAFTTALGMGGRHSTTTSRCAAFELAWCAVWNRALTGDERTQVLDHVRGTHAKPRGIYIHRDDAPTRATMLRLNGQSNASGRALVAELAGPEAARSFTKVYAASATQGTRPTIPPALLSVGTNQTAEVPSGQFGLETPFAWAWEDGRAGLMYLTKSAQGSTYLAPSSLGAPVTATTTWAAGETFLNGFAWWSIRDHWDVVQACLNSGIGLDWVWCWMQGEQDATSTTFSAVYQAQLQALSDLLDTHCGTPTKRIICRIRDQDPTFNATAVAQVRAAQAAFVAANANSVLIDTDAMTLAADQVHYNAAGMRLLGAAVYAAMP